MKQRTLSDAEPRAWSPGFTRGAQTRPPWLLIAAALLLALLSAVLWAKWRDSRVRADRLQAELRQVYNEAESLRTEAARTRQQLTHLERELREMSLRVGREAAVPRRNTGR